MRNSNSNKKGNKICFNYHVKKILVFFLSLMFVLPNSAAILENNNLITLSQKHVSILDALKEIENVSDYIFVLTLTMRHPTNKHHFLRHLLEVL